MAGTAQRRRTRAVARSPSSDTSRVSAASRAPSRPARLARSASAAGRGASVCRAAARSRPSDHLVRNGSSASDGSGSSGLRASTIARPAASRKPSRRTTGSWGLRRFRRRGGGSDGPPEVKRPRLAQRCEAATRRGLGHLPSLHAARRAAPPPARRGARRPRGRTSRPRPAGGPRAPRGAALRSAPAPRTPPAAYPPRRPRCPSRPMPAPARSPGPPRAPPPVRRRPRTRRHRSTRAKASSTSPSPWSRISNTPASLVEPKRFFSARRVRYVRSRSPSNESTQSTRCSSTRGPASDPSFVTWPTRRVAIPRSFATRMTRPATSRTWPTEPGAPLRAGSYRTCTESITHASGRSASSVASTASRSVSATIGTPSAPLPSRSARSFTCAADSSPDTYSTSRPAAARLPSAPVVSVDLPIPGNPPIRTSEPGTRPPPSTRSSSPMPVRRRWMAGASTSASRTGRRAWPPRTARPAPRAPGEAEPRPRRPRAHALRSVRPGELHRSFVDLLEQPVAGTEFLAVDTETNGLAGDLCELTEVGAVLVGGGELHETFDSVVRTERPLSRGIQRFTGITQAMVDAAPPARDVLEELAEMLEGRVLLAHNARFDRRVLQQAFERCGIDWPRPPVLCTVQLARRFAPLARKRGLASLAGSLGIEVEEVHRALPDALTCARVFCALFPRLCANVPTVGDAVELLRGTRRARKTEPGERIPPSERPDLSTLPDDPGVYIFRDERGKPLYVGKSISLRSRARAHFCAPAGWTERAAIVDYRPTNTELGALVLENRLIKAWGPPGNRRLKRTDGYVYLRCRLDIPYPVLEVAPEPAGGHAVNVGPLRGKASAVELKEQLGSLFALRPRGRKM